MTYATIRDVPASWERYALVGDVMTHPIPAGLLLHVAGPTDEGFRMIDVWASREDFERFQETRRLEVETIAPATLRVLDGIATIHGVASDARALGTNANNDTRRDT